MESDTHQREESPTRRKVRELHAAGRSTREIATELGISTQRVLQHLARLRKLAAAREKEAS